MDAVQRAGAAAGGAVQWAAGHGESLAASLPSSSSSPSSDPSAAEQSFRMQAALSRLSVAEKQLQADLQVRGVVVSRPGASY